MTHLVRSKPGWKARLWRILGKLFSRPVWYMRGVELLGVNHWKTLR